MSCEKILNNIVEFVRTWKILILYGLAVLFGCYFTYKNNDNIIANIYNALDVSSAVALALLAGFAYWQYSSELSKKKKFLEQLETISTIENKDVLLGIQFGGGNYNATEEMSNFAKELGIHQDMIKTYKFGDSDNKVSKKDIEELERVLKNDFMPQYTGADKIHLTLAGAGIAFYTCADIFSNWKPIIVYHRDKSGKYEKWTSDNKHREKIEKNLSDVK